MKKKIILITSIIFLIIIITLFLIFKLNNKNNNKIIISREEKVINKLKNNDSFLLLVDDEEIDLIKVRKLLNNTKKLNNLDYIDLYTKKDNETNDILNLLNYNFVKDYPILIIVKDGMISAFMINSVDDKNVKKFLKENNLKVE